MIFGLTIHLPNNGTFGIPPAPPVTALKLPQIVSLKSSDLLARELRKQILSGALSDGDALPPERDLVAQTGLSRGSVREALRILEAEQLVRTRPGRSGGSVAVRPGHDALDKSLSMFVLGRQITLLSLLQTREALEPSLAALAAQNRTKDELAQLEQVTLRVEEAFDDVPLFLTENVNWHCAIAAASHNELLQAVMISLSGMVYKATAMENFATPEVRTTVVKTHRRILDAIAKKDAEVARQRMARHLAAVTAAFRAFPRAPMVLEI